MMPKKTSAKPGSTGFLFTPRPAASAWPAEFLIANIDGGARGNPGPAGYGAFIRDQKGQTVAELSAFLGHQTNNVAEYSALLAALDFAVERGARAMKVISDSELLVKQIKGIYKVKNLELQRLHEQARARIARLDRFEISHVLRARNRDADRLANQAMDSAGTPSGAGSRDLPSPKAAGAKPASSHGWSGTVRGGVVEFEGEQRPAEGARVRIRLEEQG